MPVFMLFIVNKSGSLIFRRTFGDAPAINPSVLEGNWCLNTASIWGTYVTGLSKQIGPVPKNPEEGSGAELVEGHDHNVHYHATATGTSFIFFTDTLTLNVKPLYDDLYQAYVDAVLKHPMYTLDSTGAGDQIKTKSYSYFVSLVDNAVARFAVTGGR